MTSALAAATGVALVGGVLLLWHGLRRRVEPVPRQRPGVWQRWTRRPAGAAGRRRDRRLLIGAACGLLAYAVTGWVLVLLATPFAVAGLPWLLGAPANRDIELLSALDRWVRTLTATLPTGKSVADAIRLSRRNVPPAIADEVAEAVAALADRWSVRDALLRMADRLDSADADAVLAALILCAHRGGMGAVATLTALSESIQQRLAALREIEAERAKPRVVVRQVTVITLVALAATMIFSRGFFAPYRTWTGQLILIGLGLAYAGSLVTLRLMVNPPRRPRILGRGPRSQG